LFTIRKLTPVLAMQMKTFPKKMNQDAIPSETKKVPEFLRTRRKAFMAETQKFFECSATCTNAFLLRNLMNLWQHSRQQRQAHVAHLTTGFGALLSPPVSFLLRYSKTMIANQIIARRSEPKAMLPKL